MAPAKQHPYFESLKQDKKFAKVLEKHRPLEIARRKNVVLRLCASIMSQQLSTKVAKVIYDRFIGLFDGKEPTPQQILDVPFEKLRGIGLSNAKANYVRNVAAHAIGHGMEDKKLYKMSHEEVLEFLLPIKGVGRWTIEMLLMFTLGHEDVFAPDDLGIQQAMCAIYKIDPADKKAMRERMLKISAKWSPYRSYACLHLWRFKDVVE